MCNLARRIPASMFVWLLVALSAAGNSGICFAAAEDGWGTLSGRFVITGDIPKQETLDVTRDEEVCGLPGLKDESLLINAENRGIANVVIFLDSRDKVPVHPALTKAASKPAVLDNKDCRFVPRIVRVQTGQTLRMLNNDPVVHNAAAYLRRSIPFNEIIPTAKPSERVIGKAERGPARVDCSIHPWMRAWLVVLDHPYSVITDADGNFELRDIPAGEHTFHLWHERSGSLSRAVADGAVLETDRGRLTLDIPDGGILDLGEIQVTAEQLTGSSK